MNSKPSTSFAEIVEEIPLESYEDTTDGPKNGALRRSSTDAHTSNYHSPLRVRFNSLSTGRARQFSEDGVELLTAKAHEIGHAHWQGGWQNTVLKKRCKGWSPRSEEEEVKEIAQAMEEDSRLMTDDVDGEVQRRDALRELTKSLKFKKEVKERLTLKQRSVRRASTKRISFYMSFKYSFRMKWFRFKESLKSAWRDYSLWHRAIKDVEGMYGTSVGSYFHFLKSLFLLNMVVAFITVGYVLIPQLLENKRLKSEKSNDEIPPSELTTPSDIFYYEYITTIKPFLLSSQNVTISTSSNNATFGLMDCITGAGWFSDTALYYGGYSTGIILASLATNGTSSTSYDMTCAYFVTITTCFIIYFIALLCRILKMYRENFIDTEADVNVTFVEKVFSAWDFTITEEKSAAIKKRNIFNELIGEAYWTHSFEMLLYPIIVTLLMGSELGEEIYRLVVIDFIYIALSTLVVDSLKPYIVASGKASDSILEFSIPRNSIHSMCVLHQKSVRRKSSTCGCSEVSAGVGDEGQGEYLPRYAASPSRSVPTTPNFTDESIADPKHLTKRSSFVFERRTSGAVNSRI
ncbi:Transmembrane channel-like protein 5 [Armadillidium vulgare]|nr:Transmembrane channel-like protein 5 [Armadillidium vulgare]